MKKTAIGIIALISIAAFYYFTVGASQITEEIKTQVNTQLTSLEKEGFIIEERNIKKKKEHFVISFNEPKKISHFLYQQGLQVTTEDVEMLKGLKLGVDVYYLPDAYALVSFDIYPLQLPDMITSSSSIENKHLLEQIEQLLNKKTLLMHVAISKTASNFKGYIKDINETIKSTEELTIRLSGLDFKGDIKNHKIDTLKQKLRSASLLISNEMEISLFGVQSEYSITGKTLYDYTTHYHIENILTDIKPIQINIKNIDITSSSEVKENLASGTIKATFAQTHITDNRDPYTLENLIFEMKVSNIDVNALNRLQQIDTSDEKAMDTILQQFFSKGIMLKVPKLSLKSIENDGQKIDGFELSANLLFQKDFDIFALETNPFSLLNSIDADLKFQFSKELYELMAQQPPLMMALMMVPPKDENDKKKYTLELKNGKVTVNGKPMM